MTTLEVAHAKAGKDLLAALVPALTVYDGKLPDNVTTVTRPYVLLYSAVEWEWDNPNGSLLHESSSCVTTFYAHCVGENDTACGAVAGRVRSAWLDVMPVVAGRVCGPIRLVSVQPPFQDNNLGVAVLDVIAIYEYESRPA